MLKYDKVQVEQKIKERNFKIMKKQTIIAIVIAVIVVLAIIIGVVAGNSKKTNNRDSYSNEGNV